MAALDWLALFLIAASLVLGAWRGLLYEVLALAGWALAFVTARWSAQAVGDWLPMGESPEPLRYAAGFALVFIVLAFAGGLLASLARQAGAALGLRPVDRVFGAAFGALRAALVLLLLAALVGMTPLAQAPWWRESLAGPWLESALRRLHPFIPEGLGAYLST